MGGGGGAALHKGDRDGGLLVGDLSGSLFKLPPSSVYLSSHGEMLTPIRSKGQNRVSGVHDNAISEIRCRGVSLPTG